MPSSEERQPSNVQKKICHGNCQLPSKKSVSVQPCSCLVVQNNWNESDSRKRTRSSRTESSQGADKNRKFTTNEASSTQSTADVAQTLGQKSPGARSPKRPPHVTSRLVGNEILPSHGQTGPAEIGPDKHKPTKTSELRTQWTNGGYSLSKDNKKHLKDFHRLPFVSCGKESTCVEFVTDRIQKINHEKKEKEAQSKAEAAEQEKLKSVDTIKTEANVVSTSTPVAQAETTSDVVTNPSSTAEADTPTENSKSASTNDTSISDAEKSDPPSVGLATGILAAAFSFSRPPPTTEDSTFTTSDANSTPSRSTKAAKN